MNKKNNKEDMFNISHFTDLDQTSPFLSSGGNDIEIKN